MKAVPLEPFIFILFVISTTVPTCLCEDDSRYTTCSNAFRCGSSVTNLKYPFWGRNRDKYCGSQELTCEENVPKITIHDIKYRILHWDDAKTLTVARDDWSNICVAGGYKNITFDNTPFQYDSDVLFNLTLYYECPSSSNPNSITNPYSTGCGNDVYYTFGPFPYSYTGPCKIVVIPISQNITSLVSADSNAIINTALNDGFGLEWTGNQDQCKTCTDSDGECGFDAAKFQCFCKDGPQNASCPHSGISSFQCANLKNLSYPFWGSSRPQYCGHPAFKLQCTGEVAMITIMSESYKLLEVNHSDHRLRVVRNDYWNSTCPTSLRNITLGCTFFDYGSDSQNLSLYYDCPTPPFPQPGSFSPRFNCSVNATQMINYFVVESMLENAESSEILGACKSRVAVPILESEAEVLETNSTVENLKVAVDNGFNVEWNANNSLCDECQNSGGHCGYNPSSSQFACYCKDGSFPSSCKSGDEQQTMLSLLSTTTIITILILSLHHTTSLPPHATLSTCHVTTFNCGTITNLSYPFTGGDRPSFCGPPQFRLNCQNGVVPELNISSVSYRVIRVNSAAQTLTLARVDLWNETCMHVYVNSTFDVPIFSYDSGNQNLTLFYECLPSSAFSKPPENLFHCERNGNKNNSYSLVGPLPLDPILGVVECDERVEVAILEEQAERLVSNRSLLGEVLMKGFNVKYTDPYDSECDECRGHGGQCGFDDDNNEHICICGDQLCPSSGKSNKGVSIGAGVGGAVILVVILGCVFFMMKRRRKIAYNKSRSGDLFMAPSSADTFTSTTITSQTQSVSSYQSSKSNIVPPRSYYFGVQVFTYEELEEATKNFDTSRELGEGGFGTVYLGELKDGRTVAVKRLYESNFKRMEQFMNEVEILARIRHKNLVTLYGCTSRHSRELLLVYEFIPNGTVADHLQGERSKSNLLPWPIRLNIAVETAEALAYLHSKDVIHRDVKTNNILLDDKFCVKVADFGLSRLFPNHVTHVSTAPQGTPGYVDPEYYRCYQLTDKSDVYSFGVVLIELISSLQAVDINRHRNDVNLANMAVNKIQNQELHELVDPYLGFERDHAMRRMTTAVAELAFRCLQQEREMRPSMDEVVDVLRGIKSGDLGEGKDVEVLEIRTDEVRLLKKVPSSVSPDSVVDKWVSGSSVSNSS
ncbi:LEAF RUST 10 DISEASE-RESISTANCE LOCUS RECEPTOR-LIKE PROTEIN KINASE-like 1.4 [Cajanus cajan]|uniref:LEAF RUST 10 DISEASE-RESISTANCE LOCUS RECEPTOR-LIKE PROTEIN KINASE-like 1.4 n=1 Tax=Cajanus cajan TaxID=3821 RepID=UPI0010FB7B62|nr:LEAF RUST 10 DISEASE-RESISTANCE LOCUS RECEPTOR-LIKE PROTEIN KINASE-like 1.4 [Cajanus cajan]